MVPSSAYGSNIVGYLLVMLSGMNWPHVLLLRRLPVFGCQVSAATQVGSNSPASPCQGHLCAVHHLEENASEASGQFGQWCRPLARTWLEGWLSSLHQRLLVNKPLSRAIQTKLTTILYQAYIPRYKGIYMDYESTCYKKLNILYINALLCLSCSFMIM